jgi:hypothetical protein
MTPEEELRALKIALWRWQNSTSWQQGCDRWKEVSKLIGWDMAKDEPPGKQKDATPMSRPFDVGAPESDEAAA